MRITAKEYLEEMANGWVIRNMKEYGNSVLPIEPLELLGIETLTRLLNMILDKKIEIIETENGYIVEYEKKI